MTQEINIFGVCLSPFIGHLLFAVVPFFACRSLLARLGLLSRIWHPALFELSLFVSILAIVAYR
jgi:hypothetical protein